MARIRKFAAAAAVLLAGAALSACTSNGSGDNSGVGSSGGTSGGGGGGGAIDGSSSSGGPSNDGTAPTNITNGGKPISGHFICTTGAKAYGDVTTAVSANGLVGDQLSALVNMLGGNSATTLLNSVINPNNVIDGKLSTFATYQLTASLFGSTIDSVGESVIMPQGTTVPAGQYAVFGISFPNNTVGLSLLQNATVSTSLAGVQQEQNVLTNALLLSLLGQSVAGQAPIWLGLQATKPYDTATLSLAPSVLNADVGDALHNYEMCVDGTFKQ